METNSDQLGAAYTSSKHGLVGLTKNTAAFYAKKGVRCNAILPGGMSTNIMGDMIQTGKVNMDNIKVTMATQAMEPGISDLTDVADSVLYLCSDQAKAVSGTLMTVDKGWSAY
jgi:NAD(P)-dependent dehydrogenase (short-subunit alcohol dehydrogenase family)